MMKSILYKIFLVCFSIGLFSCDSYLDPAVDEQLTFEKTFSQRAESEQYLAYLYAYIPNDFLLDNMVGASDESYFMWDSWGVKYLNHNNGSWGVTTTDYHQWSHLYTAINQASIFIENILGNEDITMENRQVMQAEARFLRAYYYFLLVRQYGAVYVWGDKSSDVSVIAADVDRHPHEVAVTFISDELTKAAEELPLKISDSRWYGKATKGAALGLKSRLLLYTARPLYNGNTLYSEIINKDGEHLFPQNKDPQKWELAAKAAKEVIDLNVYKLQTSTAGENSFQNAILGYSDVLFKQWNDELIYGRWTGAMDTELRAAPFPIVENAFGGFAPSLKLVDAYPMVTTGRYPIRGYQSNGEPIIDSKSGYDESGFTDNYRNPADVNENHIIRVNNSCVGRDARFYASICFSGMYWINTFHGSKMVTFHKGGTAYNNTHTNYNRSGYVFRRLLNPANDTQKSQWGNYSWPHIRLAEIYLNYAEACNEKPNRDEAEAIKYVDLVRQRAGLNKLEEAYPNEIKNNQSLLREIIRMERMVELSFENHRYFDLRTWMIADKESNGNRYGRVIHAETFEGFWGRTSEQVLPIVFESKHYLFPILQTQLDEMKNITQNYGW